MQDMPDDDGLKNNLHAIHVSHAFAARSSDASGATSFRASPIPLSVAATDMGPVDMAEAPADAGTLPVFATDWKEAQRGQVAQSLPDVEAVPLQRVAIVRNAINPATGAAAESALFAFHAIDPTEREWRCNVTINADAVEHGSDPQRVLAQFRKLIGLGLLGLGKTKARAEVSVGGPWRQAFAPEAGPEEQVQPGETLRMLLISDADLLGAVEELPGTGGASVLRRLYQEYFDKAFGRDRLQLKEWFTTESLAGGRYIHRRFWSNVKTEPESGKASAHATYRPHVMTGTGSLFVFRVSKDLDEDSLYRLRSDLERACRFGLTPAPILGESEGATADPRYAWRHHPWLPAQGYGEILLQPHLGLPKTSEVSNASD